MKKTAAILITVMMAISLAACGNDGTGQLGTSSFGKNSTVDDTTNDNSSDDNILSGGSLAENGDPEYIWGELGDKMSTAWFDFTIKSATLCGEYSGNTPADGCQYLVLEMRLENTYLDSEPVPIYYDDFDVEWEDPDSYELPVFMKIDGQTLSEDNYEFQLRFARNADATMVYEVPEEYEEYYVYFDEYFADGTMGNVIAVYLVPEQE